MSTRLAFVDLETTGGSPVEDRITEVGIIEVDLDDVGHELGHTSQPVVREWASLVNPETRIPEFIETLTGITNAMVQSAPRFEELIDAILAKLDGRLFIAHNARFDHGFLKNALRRSGHSFRPPVLCTVRLSRKLYPGYARHNLDSLIERHRLAVDQRHRALGDARLLWQFWQKIHATLPPEEISVAIDRLTARPSLPRHLDPEVFDTMPTTAGVYLFHGGSSVNEGSPLYIGKAKNLRQRVLSHFSGDHLSAREMEISQQLTRIEWIETGGGTQHDLGALLAEATLVKQRAPLYNRQLRKSDDVCAWRLVVEGGGRDVSPSLCTGISPPPRPSPSKGERVNGAIETADRKRDFVRWHLGIARPDDLFFGHDADLYGPFNSPRQASATLLALADAHGLCPALLKLEKHRLGKPCFAYQVKRCRGACVGEESVAEHTARLADAFASLALKPWPFAGAIGIREGDSLHVVNGWAWLGMAASVDEARQLAIAQRPFDQDVYRLLVGRLAAIAKRITLLT